MNLQYLFVDYLTNYPKHVCVSMVQFVFYSIGNEGR